MGDRQREAMWPEVHDAFDTITPAAWLLTVSMACPGARRLGPFSRRAPPLLAERLHEAAKRHLADTAELVEAVRRLQDR
jgi:hypothetical protein